LLAAVAGAAVTRLTLTMEGFGDAAWLRIVAAGFEAALVGGLADWFAITALFRHPLGIPIPHTAILRTRREKLIEGIERIVREDWLSPEVISAQLRRFRPSTILIDWLEDPEHMERIGAPLRDVLRALVRMLGEEEVARFLERFLRRQLADVPIDRSAGEWLHRAVSSEGSDAVFRSLAVSLANLAERPDTAAELRWWLERSARTLRDKGRRIVPFLLRRRSLQRMFVEAACAYASAELRSASADPAHPLRRGAEDAVRRYADRLAGGDGAALIQVERVRAAVLESLESGPMLRDALGRLQQRLERDLDDPGSDLSSIIDSRLHRGILQVLSDPARREAFDRWVQATAIDLARRHHHEIGRTVRENLEKRDPDELIRQIEDRVGADLQFIRLNGAVVGGLIGIALATAHWLVG
jgi:uncharacterized membrane-anchored protein YjiN (DUF445 family)